MLAAIATPVACSLAFRPLRRRPHRPPKAFQRIGEAADGSRQWSGSIKAGHGSALAGVFFGGSMKARDIIKAVFSDGTVDRLTLSLIHI